MIYRCFDGRRVNYFGVTQDDHGDGVYLMGPEFTLPKRCKTLDEAISRMKDYGRPGDEPELVDGSPPEIPDDSEGE